MYKYIIFCLRVQIRVQIFVVNCWIHILSATIPPHAIPTMLHGSKKKRKKHEGEGGREEEIQIEIERESARA